MNGRRSCGSSQGIEIGISEALGLLVERVNAAAMLLDDTIAASRREVITTIWYEPVNPFTIKMSYLVLDHTETGQILLSQPLQYSLD